MKKYNTLKILGMSALIGISAALMGNRNNSEIEVKPLKTSQERYEFWKKIIDDIPYEEWEKAGQNFERENKKSIEDKLNPALPENINPENKSGEYNIPHIEEITREMKYYNGPSKFAGNIKDNKDVRVIERNGKEIKSIEGLASYYSREEGFKITATGSQFYDDLPTAAINERLGYKIPCIIGVTNVENGEYVEAVANDYGPYKFNKFGNAIGKKVKQGKKKIVRYTPHDKRIVDLSPALARQLGFEDKGLTKVKVEYIRPLEIKKL